MGSTAWVLIILLTVSNGGGGTATAEFSNRGLCEEAAKAVQDAAGKHSGLSVMRVTTVCVHK